MKAPYWLLILTTLFLACNNKAPEKKSKSIVFSLNEGAEVRIPLSLNDSVMSLFNAQETIVCPLQNNIARLPVFESYFEFSDDFKSGWWYDPSRGADYRIAFEIEEDKYTVKNKEQLPEEWEVQFGDAEDAYTGKLLLNSSKTPLEATILTETGDYRYLHGTYSANKLRLQTFDGAHLFLFTANRISDSLVNGTFYSGKHYKESWIASVNEDFEMAETEDIVKALNDQLSFEVSNSDGSKTFFSTDSFMGAPHILQIMGTWCPNCMDESRLLAELYSKYKDQGLKVSALCFERYKNQEDAWRAIEKAKADLQIEYPVYLAGMADKNEAAQLFPFIDQLYSFPTTIFINDKAEIIEIHSGFNGPATGEAYAKQKEKFESTVIEALNLNASSF